MKKFIYSAIAIFALPFAVTSCSDEDDLPNVDYTIQVAGGVVDDTDGTIYVVQGDTLSIESVTVTNLDSDKAAAITGAEYFWDYAFIGNSSLPPYGFDIVITENTPVGNHNLSIRTGVVAVDKEPAVGIVGYNVAVVSSADDIPDTAVSTTQTTKAGTKKS